MGIPNVTATYQNITLKNTGASSTTNKVIGSGVTLGFSGALTVNQGTFDLTTNTVPLVVRGGITVANSALASLTTNSNVRASGSIVVNPTATLTVSAGTWTMYGVAQNLSVSGKNIPTLVISSSSGTTLTGPLTVSSSLTVDSAPKLTLGANNLHATGSTVTNNGLIREDSTGKLFHTATAVIADSSYNTRADIPANSDVYFKVTDAGENLNASAIETLTATATLGSDTETLTLTESSAASGIFRGGPLHTATSNATANNGTLESSDNGTIILTFADEVGNATGSATFTLGSSAATGGGGSGGGGGGGGGGRGKSTAKVTPKGRLPSVTQKSKKTEKPQVKKGTSKPSRHKALKNRPNRRK
jgi:hypothetical protein